MTLVFADEVLPFKSIFHPTIVQVNKGDLVETTINIDIPEGYYLYRDKLIPQLEGDARVQYSATTIKQDPYFGEVEIFDHSHPAVITITQTTAQDIYPVAVQGCKDNVICYPPEIWQLSVNTGGDIATTPPPVGGFLQSQRTLPPPTSPSLIALARNKAETVNTTTFGSKTTNPSNNTTKALASLPITSALPTGGSNVALIQQLSTNYWLTLPWIVLLGIAMSFTACIYPLIPIVTSLVVGKNTTQQRARGLILVYVLGIASAMALLGAIFGLFRINLQVVLQQRWITWIVAAFFILLALSLFGAFKISMPSILKRYADAWLRRLPAGSYLSAAVMGALSMLVVSPCATPILTALLLYTTQTTPAKGALLLFFFGIGTGIPLLIYTSVFRRFLPRAGQWMDTIKKIFGWLLVAVAIWLVTRIAQPAYAWTTWMLYALAISIFLLHITPLTGKGRPYWQYLTALAFLVSIIFAVQLGNLPRYNIPTNNATAYAATPSQRFQLIDDADTLRTVIANSDKPVIVDFYADWCLSCIVWEKTIWQNPAFTEALADYTLIKIDVTDFNSKHREIFKILSIVGPPVVLFYPPKGDIKSPTERIVGEMTPEDFSQFLTKLTETRRK